MSFRIGSMVKCGRRDEVELGNLMGLIIDSEPAKGWGARESSWTVLWSDGRVWSGVHSYRLSAVAPGSTCA